MTRLRLWAPAGGLNAAAEAVAVAVAVIVGSGLAAGWPHALSRGIQSSLQLILDRGRGEDGRANRPRAPAPT